jgi:hypothetical protein
LTARAAAQGKDLPALTHLLQQSAHNSMLSSFPFVAFPVFSFLSLCVTVAPVMSSSIIIALGSKRIIQTMNEQEWGKGFKTYSMYQ